MTRLDFIRTLFLGMTAPLLERYASWRQPAPEAEAIAEAAPGAEEASYSLPVPADYSYWPRDDITTTYTDTSSNTSSVTYITYMDGRRSL